MARHRRRVKVRRRRDTTPLSNVQAAILTAVAGAVIVAIMITVIVRHERSLAEWDVAIPAVPWDSSWPSLPVVPDVERTLPVDLTDDVYAFAGRNPELLQYVPCYCGCRSQGHRSNLECYVRQHAPNGQVTEWNSHGHTCPVGPDITGDVMLWHQDGTPLSTIRDHIDHEFSSRGPATPTPPVPRR